jgi:hypothetical protein
MKPAPNARSPTLLNITVKLRLGTENSLKDSGDLFRRVGRAPEWS